MISTGPWYKHKHSCSSLGKTTIAEFVEDGSVMEVLKELKINHVQVIILANLSLFRLIRLIFKKLSKIK